MAAADLAAKKLETAAEVANRILALARSAGEALPAGQQDQLAAIASEVDPLIRELRAGRVPARALEIASNRAKVVLMGADSWIAAAMLRHAALGKASTYDGAMLRFLAKARGLAKPSKAVDDAQREAEAKRAIDLSNLPREKVIDIVLDGIRNEQVIAGGADEAA